MKAVSILSLFALFLSTANAFAPSPAFARVPRTSPLKADPEDEEEGLDLNLEEMFDMFDAADSGEDFDKAVEKIKSSDDN